MKCPHCEGGYIRVFGAIIVDYHVNEDCTIDRNTESSLGKDDAEHAVCNGCHREFEIEYRESETGKPDRVIVTAVKKRAH